MNVVSRPPLEPPPVRRRRTGAWIKEIARLLGSLLVEGSVFPVLPSADDTSAAAAEQDSTWSKWGRIVALMVLMVGVALVMLPKMAAYRG